ncbi:MAG: hypothetical protein ACFE9Z_12225 [Promethearchaeota archaeon]
MKSKYIILGIFVIGFLFLGVNYSYGFEEGTDESEAGEEEGGGGDEIPDDDEDGVDDDYEDENKRDIEIWIGESVVEISSIRRSENRKDIIDLRVGYDDYGLSVRVSYGTFIKECEPVEEECPEGEEDIVPKHEEYCEEIVEYKLVFEVLFRGLIEFIEHNGDGVLDEEHDEVISEYGFHSFQPIDYSLTSISDDTNLHYLLFNTTDGVFATHIYLVEEFVYVDEILISPTEVKIDLEITNYDYQDENSQLALFTKLWSEEKCNEGEETVDEKEGYATDEKDVNFQNDKYSGFFSWKETALIDGVEMDVLTREIVYEDDHHSKLFLCYPRGFHIYHDPKIGIFIGQSAEGNLPIIITTGAISVIGISGIVVVLLKKRRIL